MMSAPKLRDYQQALVDRIETAMATGLRRILAALPTGGGKTVCAVALVITMLARGLKVLLIVHRHELVLQTSSKLYASRIDHGVIAAGFSPRPGAPVQIAMVGTLHARAVRTSTMGLPEADLVIVDEAHHARARTWQRIIDTYPNAAVVGLTATPARGDGRGLGDVFEVLIEGPSVAELITARHLVGTKVYAPSSPDLTGVTIRHGDYAEGELAQRVNTPKLVGDIVTTWLKLAGRRPTVVFATNVAHAVHLRDEFCRAGITAEVIDGTTPNPDREPILARLASGATEVVVNCAVLTEGWDSPVVSCVVLARPTQSMVLYRQIVGRGLRPAPGKSDCLVLDHSGTTLRLGFIDEHVEWTLAPDKPAARKSDSDGLGSSRKLTTCPECDAVRWSGRPCSACGWRPRPKPAAVDVVDGELGQVDRDRTVRMQQPTASDKKCFYAELLFIASERGYQQGWAAHKHRERYGTWPSSRFVAPIEPRPETRSWVRSRFIAYAKARAKAGAA
ncbi:MAG: DEAD/DEAH box helicase [Reyranella sp.]|uniref:DEAD/DEAH box helicase n=1 Tax=Reyranella sp. TaxID=1929291 RepID=UPI003D0D3A39